MCSWLTMKSFIAAVLRNAPGSVYDWAPVLRPLRPQDSHGLPTGWCCGIRLPMERHISLILPPLMLLQQGQAMAFAGSWKAGCVTWQRRNLRLLRSAFRSLNCLRASSAALPAFKSAGAGHVALFADRFGGRSQRLAAPACRYRRGRQRRATPDQNRLDDE